jgi:hypothetical protein
MEILRRGRMEKATNLKVLFAGLVFSIGMIDSAVNGEAIVSGIEFLSEEYEVYGVLDSDSYHYVDVIPVSGSIVTAGGQVSSTASPDLVGAYASSVLHDASSRGNSSLVFRPSEKFLRLSYAIYVSCLNDVAYIRLYDYTDDVMILNQTGTVEEDWLLPVEPSHDYGLEMHASTILDYSSQCNSYIELYELSSVPEPSTLLLLALGTVLLCNKR